MKASKRSTRKFYAIQYGRNGFKGVLETWQQCQRVVSGVSGARFKSFKSRPEAVAFAHLSPNKDTGVRNLSLVAKRNEKPSEDPSVSKDAIVVYTDGACAKNGQRGSRAGVGVFFGENSEYNISEPLEGTKQTNQRAEMTAVIRALTTIYSMEKKVSDVVILTDSQYTRTGYYDWMPKWKRNRWKTSSGTDVLNRDLWEELDKTAELVKECGMAFLIKWVRGHAGEYGNEMADRLAVEGALK